MYEAILRTLVLATTILLPLPSAPRAAPQTSIIDAQVRSTRPNVVENGSGFLALPFPAPLSPSTSDVAFTPDGTAYFINQGTADGIVRFTRVSPNGTYSSVPMPRARSNTPSLIFARGNFWMAASPGGILKVSPDGSRVHWFALADNNDVQAIVLGRDGAIYYTVLTSAPLTSIYSGHVYRIAANDTVTSVSVPVYPHGAAAVGADGRLYFAYVDASFSNDGIARLESDGTTTLFPVISGNGQSGEARIGSMALSNGKLYFQDRLNAVFGSLAPSGPTVNIPLPPSLRGPEPDHVSVDFGGNVWLDIFVDTASPAVSSHVYQFNTHTGRFNGPYFTGYPTYHNVGGPYVGPDDNQWLKVGTGGDYPYAYVSALGVIVRHVQTLEPASLSITAAQAIPFAILETHFNGPWTAQSLNPSVATVAPSSSTTGDFTVSETGPGMTSIAVKDRLGNVSYELVTAH